jgi:hypothetical protein
VESIVTAGGGGQTHSSPFEKKKKGGYIFDTGLAWLSGAMLIFNHVLMTLLRGGMWLGMVSAGSDLLLDFTVHIPQGARYTTFLQNASASKAETLTVCVVGSTCTAALHIASHSMRAPLELSIATGSAASRSGSYHSPNQPWQPLASQRRCCLALFESQAPPLP